MIRRWKGEGIGERQRATELHDGVIEIARRHYEQDGFAAPMALVFPVLDSRGEAAPGAIIPNERDDTTWWAAVIRREVQRRRARLVVVVTEAWMPPLDLPPEAAIALKMQGVSLADLPGARDTLVVSASTPWGTRLYTCDLLGNKKIGPCADTGWEEEGWGGTMTGLFQ